MIIEQLKDKIKSYWEEDPEVIQYSLRDPMLYGDFRNACNENELRFYEDLLDYEAVYNLFLEVCLIGSISYALSHEKSLYRIIHWI